MLWPCGQGWPGVTLQEEVPAQPGQPLEANAVLFREFSLQFFNRTGVSQLHRAFHLPRVTDHLPPAEPDLGGNGPALPATRRRALALGSELSPLSGVVLWPVPILEVWGGGCEI